MIILIFASRRRNSFPPRSSVITISFICKELISSVRETFPQFFFLRFERNSWYFFFSFFPFSTSLLLLLCQVVVQLPRCAQFFVTPWTAARQASLSLTISQSLPKFMPIASVMPYSLLILWYPLLLLSVFPSIRVFSSKSAVHVWWPKYWSFNLDNNPFDEYSGLVSLKIDWFDFLAVQGTLKSLLQHHSSKAFLCHTSHLS